ncbi:MAG: hypothetical protein ACE5KE_12795, partial [Methanosarcinales archaeon]
MVSAPKFVSFKIKMEIRFIDAKRALEDMREGLHEYKAVATKRRGMEPYISMYCMDHNVDVLGMINGIRDFHSHKDNRYVIVMVQYESGLPAYDVAENHSPIEIHRALWEAEASAWQEYHEFIGSDRELNPKRLLHPPGPKINDHVKLEDLGIVSFA